MLKKSISILLTFVLVISILAVYPFTTSVCAAISNPASTPRITYAGQVVDSITYRGSTVNAVYTPYRDGLATDWTYGCFVLPRTFYSTIYGITVSNLNSTTSIPNASSGYFEETRSPRKGDIIRCNNYVHWALVKEVNGTTVTIIQQNAWWNSYTCAQVGNTVSSSDNSVSFFTYSGYLPDGNPNPTPDFTPVYLGEHFFANIINQSCGKAVAAVGDNAGDNVELQPLDGILLHKWEFAHQGNNAYKIYNNHSGKCLDVDGAYSDNGTNVKVYDPHDTDAQLWYFKAVGSGYSLVPKCALNSCLDLAGGSTADGTNIQLWSSNSTKAQIFTLNYLPSFVAQNLGEHFYANIINQKSGKAIVPTGDNAGDNVVLSTLNGNLLYKWEFIRQGDWSYKIVNNHSGKFLDVNGGYSDDGTNIKVYDSHDTDAQLWYFKAVGSGYSLVPKCAMNSCLDIYGGNTSDGSNIQLWNANDTDAQIFTLNYLPSFVAQNLGEHFYANIVNQSSDKPIVAVGDNNGDNVELGEFSGEIISKWEFIRHNDWSYTIVNNHSGKCLDVYNAGTANATNVQVYDSNSTNAQLWYIKSVGDGYSLVPKCAINSALDLYDGKTETGTNISIFQQNSTAAQIFCFNYQPADIVLDLGESFTANIIHQDSGYAVSYNNDGNVLIYSPDKSDSQKWLFERTKDMSYRITNVSTGLCLDVYDRGTSNGTNVHIYKPNDTIAQRWFIVQNGKGYSLIPKCAVTKALDLSNGITEGENCNLQIWGFEKGNISQIYSINLVLLDDTTPTEPPTNPPAEPPTNPPTTPPSDPPTATVIFLGDADKNGVVNVFDASYVQKGLTGTSGYPEYSKLDKSDIEYRVADVDGSGAVNIFDAAMIQKYLTGTASAQSYGIGDPID